MSAHETIDPVPAATPHPVATPSPIPAVRRGRPGLITDWHLSRLVIIYIRQSNPQQILDHRESRERQYALVNYAIALGWPRDRILMLGSSSSRLMGTRILVLAVVAPIRYIRGRGTAPMQTAGYRRRPKSCCRRTINQVKDDAGWDIGTMSQTASVQAALQRSNRP